MTNDKRYRTESIEGLTSWFIVDELSAKKKSDKITSFKAYDTHSKRKCDELTDLLNNYVEENEQLKSDIILIEKRADTVYDEIEQIKKDLKVVLPVLLAIDFKMSVNECEVMNRLAELLDDDFVKGVECE